MNYIKHIEYTNEMPEYECEIIRKNITININEKYDIYIDVEFNFGIEFEIIFLDIERGKNKKKRIYPRNLKEKNINKIINNLEYEYFNNIF